MKQIASKIKISLDNSDGTTFNLESIIPQEITEEIISWVIGWKKHWYATIETIEAFQESSKELINQEDKK